jgi:hypothetical protein
VTIIPSTHPIRSCPLPRPRDSSPQKQSIIRQFHDFTRANNLELLFVFVWWAFLNSQVNTPFAVLRLEATDAKERDLWMQAISKVVSELKAATRGYLWHKNTSMFEKAWSRKFFIVHDDSITSHEDHMKTSTILSAVKLSEGTVTVEFRLDCQLAVMRGGVDLMILRAAEEDERDTWAAAIKQAAKGSGAAAEEASGAAEESGETRTLLKASLEVRADSQRAKNDKWFVESLEIWAGGWGRARNYQIQEHASVRRGKLTASIIEVFD